MKIAAVVVLYYPSEEVYENILSYISMVDIVYAVDNSDIKDEIFVRKLTNNRKIHYLDNEGNKGIAHALNRGAQEALKEKYDFLLTMDQDSKASAHMLSAILTCLSHIDMSKIGILSPFHASPIHKYSKEKGCVEKRVVMTSGNLLSLKAYKESGPFMEELFLDYVDNEYCLRLRTYGYKVLQVSEAVLFHHLGELSLHHIFGKPVYCYNYPPVRYYYRTRNVIAIRHRLEAFWGVEILKDMIKIVLFEKEKLNKLQYIYFGIRDAIRGKMGKYDG